MSLSARFVHTDTVAHDWRRLADFYEWVFSYIPVPPERHFTGQWSVAIARMRKITVALLHEIEE